MTTANKISIARIFSIPVFLVLYNLGFFWSDMAALTVFLIAAASDGIDGYIARKYNQVTDLGKFLDPLADKILVSAALIELVADGKIAAWMVTIILAREFIITSLRTIAAASGRVIAASIWGKVKTVVQIVAVTVLIVSPGAGLNFYLSFAMTLVTAASGVDYLAKNRDILKDG